MKTKSVLLFTLIIVLFLSCFLFAMNPLIWNSGEFAKMQDITSDDLLIEITSNNSVIIENSIELNGMQYSWITYNIIDNVYLINDEILPSVENKIIEIHYQDITDISFISVILYDDVLYYSDRFTMDKSGNLRIIQTTSKEIQNENYSRNINDIVSFAYLIFLLVGVILYYITIQKYRWVVLLILSILFYLFSNIYHIFILLISSLIIFICANYISDINLKFKKLSANITDKTIKTKMKSDMQKQSRRYFYFAFSCVLIVIAILRYSTFAQNNINNIFGVNFDFIDFVAPLGLSFYTFILLGYLFDVYRGKYIAQSNYLKFLLFVSFFPHISQGPISRYNDLSTELYVGKNFNYKNICFAMQRILWGFFIKLILADRLAVFTGEIFANYQLYGSLMLILATFAFSIQIYTDFYSSMEIAIGSAQLFGIKLSENFMRPYFSKTMPEFWRRWHITLGTWFKDYVFYPIFISKNMLKFNIFARKKYNNYIAMVLTAIPPIFCVWLLTGFWHGAAWSFIAWGGYHGLLIILGVALTPPYQKFLNKLKINTNTVLYKFIQMVKVFILCSIGRVFFVTNSLSKSLDIFKIIFNANSKNLQFNFSAVKLSILDLIVILISILALLTVSIIKENNKSVRAEISKANIVFRWIIWYLLIISVIILGMYGIGSTPSFIYEAF